MHPDLKTGMAPSYIAFSAENAARGYFATRSAIELVLLNVRPKNQELVEWAAGALQRLPAALPQEIATERLTDEADGGHEDDGPDPQ